MSLKRAMWRICLAFLCLAQVSSLNLEQLRPSLWSLAEVLQDLTGDEHSARKTLEEKAGKVEDDGTAGLLRQLARQGRNDTKVFSSSSVSESHVDGQGHGYVLRHVKTCKNGVCEEHTEKTSPKQGNEGNEMSLKMPDQKKTWSSVMRWIERLASCRNTCATWNGISKSRTSTFSRQSVRTSGITSIVSPSRATRQKV